LIAVIGTAALLLATTVAGVGADEDLEIGVAALLYVPLLAWVGYLVWRYKLKLRPFFAAPHIGSYWWLVIGMTLVLLMFSIGASSLTSLLLPGLTEGAAISSAGNPLVMFVSLVVLPPLVEELIFRGVLLERWAVKWRLGTAVIVQAVFFGTLHADPVGAGVFGVCMALFYLRTRSLVVPMVMHAINNGIVFVAITFGGDAVQETDTSTGEVLTTGFVGLALSVPFIALFIWRNWPVAQQLTPYEEFEQGATALPPRRLGSVHVPGQPEKLRWALSDDDIVVSRDRGGKNVAWQLPYSDITHLGASQNFDTIAVAMRDGSVLTMAPTARSQRLRGGYVAALQQRVAQAPLLQLAPADRIST